MENVPVWMYPDRDPNPPETSGISDDDDVIVCDMCGGDIRRGETYYDFCGMFLNIDVLCQSCIDRFLQDLKNDSEAVNNGEP